MSEIKDGENLKHVVDRCIQVHEANQQKLSKARTRLYVASLATLTICATNAIPTQIEPLGISFTQLEAQRIMPILSLISSYFLLLFIAREFEGWGSNGMLELAWKQWNRSQALMEFADWRKKVRPKHEWRFVSASFGKWVSIVLLVVCPLIVGGLASIVGWIPPAAEWLKHDLMGT